MNLIYLTYEIAFVNNRNSNNLCRICNDEFVAITIRGSMIPIAQNAEFA